MGTGVGGVIEITGIPDIDMHQTVCETAGQGLFGVLPEWTANIGLAFMASIGIILFFYLLSLILKNDNLNVFARMEFYELVVTAIIIIVIGVVMSSVCTYDLQGIFPNAGPNDLIPGTQHYSIFQMSQYYFEQVGAKIRGWMSISFVIGVVTDQMASLTPYSRPLGVGIISAPMAGFGGPVKQLVYNIITGLSVAFIINYAQLYAMAFMAYGSLKYFFPIGIVLRSLTPTRRIGGTLIAIGVGFLVVFPLMTTISSVMFLHPTNGQLIGFDESLKQEWRQLDIVGKVTTFFTTNSAEDMVEGLKGGVVLGGANAIESTTGGIMTSFFLIPLGTVGMAFAVGYIVPAFNFLVLVEAIRQLSKSFGEEIDITTLTRLI